MTVKPHPQTLCPRRAYQVDRYHTWPHIRSQSVGEHSAQLWRILCACWGDVPVYVLAHAMTHDMGEIVLGDMPYTMKAMVPGFQTAMHEAEASVHLSMCLPWRLPPPVNLSDVEKKIFKMCENIEMWEWALDELTLGNRGARAVAERTGATVVQFLSQIKENNVIVFRDTVQYMAQRARFYRTVTNEDVPHSGAEDERFNQ